MWVMDNLCSWLISLVKNYCKKQPKKITPSKHFIFLCVCIKMNTFALFTAEAWEKNDVEVII